MSTLNNRVIIFAVLAVFLVDVALLSAFIRWAYVEHYRLYESFLYGELAFSTVDGSLIEKWGYLKEVVIVVTSAWLFWRTKEIFYGAFSILFMSVLLDDAIGLHEWLTVWISKSNLLGSLEELPMALIISGVPFVVTLVGLARLPVERRWPPLLLTAGFCLLGFFAVVVDKFHEKMLGPNASGQTIFSFIEDGGELISLTAVLAVAVFCLRVSGEASASIRKPLRGAVDRLPLANIVSGYPRPR